MNTGTVKFYNETKGFGFIIEDQTQSEYFVHSTGLKDRIRENDKVNFDIEEGRKGPIAANVIISR